jgi:hypothetical protein
MFFKSSDENFNIILVAARQAHAAFDFRLAVTFLMLAQIVVNLRSACGVVLHGADSHISQIQSVTSSGKFSVNFLGFHSQSIHKGRAIADDLRGDLAHLVGEIVQSVQ